jgi:hypothetical protein
MKKNIIFLLLAASLTLAGCSSLEPGQGNQEASPKDTEESKEYGSSAMSSEELPVEKIVIYYFHRTARCYSCNIMEQYASNLVNQQYGQQVKSGVLEFRQINIDLPENREIARKFQASGSSLFINRIINGNDNIEHDTNVWRLLGNEINFRKYLGSKIDSYLAIDR